MTAWEQAEELFDEAERRFAAAKQAERACCWLDAERQAQRAHECQDQAQGLLDQLIQVSPNFRDAC